MNKKTGTTPVGKFLQEKRESCGLTLEDVAGKLMDITSKHYTRQYIHNFECGLTPPNLHTSVLLSRILKFKMNDLEKLFP